MVSITGSNIHDPNENNHYYRQNSSPTSIEAGGGDPLQVGDLWSDTTANLLKRCTGVNPDTFASVEGGGASSGVPGVPIAATVLTIDASGDVTVTGDSYFSIAGAGGAADSLDGISGGVDGQRIILRPSDDTVRITVRNNQNAGQTKNILLAGGSEVAQNQSMNDYFDTLELVYDSGLDTNGAWLEAGRGVTWTAQTNTRGIVELATVAEIGVFNSSQVINVQNFVQSTAATRYFQHRVIANDTALTTGDNLNQNRFVLPKDFAGYVLKGIEAHVFTPSTSGLPTFQLRNVAQAADILSTRVTIDENEEDSLTATTPAVINTGEDDYTAGDELQIDCDVAGTSTKGCLITLAYRLI